MTTAPQGRTVCQGKVSSSVQQDTIVLAGVSKVYCPALLAHTAHSLASAKWSSASFVQQVRVLSSGLLPLLSDTLESLSSGVMCADDQI